MLSAVSIGRCACPLKGLLIVLRQDAATLSRLARQEGRMATVGRGNWVALIFACCVMVSL